jgi:hypothetical protein
MARVGGVRLETVGIHPGLSPGRGQLILQKAYGAGKEELRERRVEGPGLVRRAAQNGPKRVANGAFLGEIHDVKCTSGVVQLAWPDTKAVLTA